MTVGFKSLVSSANVNNAFVSRLQDTVQLGIYTLANSLSGNPINNIQKAVNKIFEDTGILNEANTNARVYTSAVIISNGDSYKNAIEKLDNQVGINVTSIGNLNSRVSSLELGTIKLREYISDSAYITANGTPVGGEIYYNSTTGRPRYYDGVDLVWKDVGGALINIQEFIGQGNGVNVNFDITNAPINTDAILVFINGRLVEKSEWSYSAPTITFNTAPSLGQRVYVSYLSNGSPASPVIVSGVPIVVYKELLSSDISSKQFTLSIAPASPSKVVLDVIGGCAQEYGVDYVVNTPNILSWSSLGLDGVLNVGDKLRVQYFS